MNSDNEILVSVTFIASASPYHADDVAGFPAAEAKAYVDKQLARYTDEAQAASAENAGLAAGAQVQTTASARTGAAPGGRVKGKQTRSAKDASAVSLVLGDDLPPGYDAGAPDQQPGGGDAGAGDGPSGEGPGSAPEGAEGLAGGESPASGDSAAPSGVE